MKELKAKAKVTQAMTRDGLTLENQATGEVENISSREAEQDYTPEAGGTAEKLLERADDAHDRHKAKKSAKQAAATAVEGDAALHRPSSQLQLRKNGPPQICSPISAKQIRKLTSWMQPVTPSRKSVLS